MLSKLLLCALMGVALANNDTGNSSASSNDTATNTAASNSSDTAATSSSSSSDTAATSSSSSSDTATGVTTTNTSSSSSSATQQTATSSSSSSDTATTGNTTTGAPGTSSSSSSDTPTTTAATSSSGSDTTTQADGSSDTTTQAGGSSDTTTEAATTTMDSNATTVAATSPPASLDAVTGQISNIMTFDGNFTTADVQVFKPSYRRGIKNQISDDANVKDVVITSLTAVAVRRLSQAQLRELAAVDYTITCQFKVILKPGADKTTLTTKVDTELKKTTDFKNQLAQATTAYASQINAVKQLIPSTGLDVSKIGDATVSSVAATTVSQMSSGNVKFSFFTAAGCAASSAVTTDPHTTLAFGTCGDATKMKAHYSSFKDYVKPVSCVKGSQVDFEMGASATTCAAKPGGSLYDLLEGQCYMITSNPLMYIMVECTASGGGSTGSTSSASSTGLSAVAAGMAVVAAALVM